MSEYRYIPMVTCHDGTRYDPDKRLRELADKLEVLGHEWECEAREVLNLLPLLSENTSEFRREASLRAAHHASAASELWLRLKEKGEGVDALCSFEAVYARTAAEVYGIWACVEAVGRGVEESGYNEAQFQQVERMRRDTLVHMID